MEENWSERLLLKVYIIVCYFSLIIFSTVELTSLCASRAVLTISIKSAPSCQLPGRKQEGNWSERFLLKVCIVCYFSLIIFSTIELTLFVMRFASCARYHFNMKIGLA